MMAYEIYGNADAMSRIRVIKPSEENLYSEIPGWGGEIRHHTDDAVLLSFNPDRDLRARYWLPFSHLRKTEDNLSIYASDWVLRKTGL